METERFYRIVLYVGAGWNFLVSVPTFFLVNSLPSMIDIEPPKYPIFIYFNLMTVFLFAWIHLLAARSPFESRPLMTILAWSKLLTVIIFAGALLFLSMPAGLIEFFLPGMIIDLILGLLFIRCIVISGRTLAVAPPASQ